MKSIYIFILGIFLMLPLRLFSQTYMAKIDYLSSLTEYDGENITAVLQDSKGLMWFGSANGLFSFDGTYLNKYSYKEYGFCNDYILHLSEDNNGFIWVELGDYSRGKSCYTIFDPIHEQFYTIEEYTGEAIPFTVNRTMISPQYNGTIIIREDKEDAYQYYEIKDKKIKKGITLLKNQLNPSDLMLDYTIKLDSLSYISLLTHLSDKYKQVQIYQDGTVNIESAKDDSYSYMFISLGDFYSIKHEQNEPNYLDITIFKNNQFICKIKNIATSFKDNEINVSNVHNFVTRVIKDKIYIIREDGVSIYDFNAKLLDVLQWDVNLSFHISSEKLRVNDKGDLWFPLPSEMVKIKITKNLFEPIFTYDLHSNESNPIRGIDTDDEGNLYISNGLYNISQFQKDNTTEPIQEYYFTNITGILKDGKQMWVAPENAGLIQLNLENGNQKHYYYSDGGIKKRFLWLPYKSSQGEIWVGAGEGLYKLDTLKKVLDAFTFDKNFEALFNSSVHHFYENKEGTWLSTSSGLYLVHLESQKILAHYSDSQKEAYYIPAKVVSHIHEDNDGTFWIATKGQGLIHWNPKTKEFQQYTKKENGLSHDVIYAVYADDFNSLWLPSSKGLMRFDKTSKEVITYLEEDGISNNEFNTISHHQDKNGNLYFGSINGLVKFHPKNFNIDDVDVPLLLNNVYRINRSTEERINIKAKTLEKNTVEIYDADKYIEFQFSLLNYKKPSSNEFAYKLEGYHDKWIYTKNPMIQIGAYPYGNYQLRFKARTSGNFGWQEYEQDLTLSFVKPFYLRWWFMLFSIVSILGIILFLVRRNTRLLLKRQEILENTVAERTAQIQKDKALIEEQAEELKQLDKVKSKFFANISHELRTPLTLILGPLSYILENPQNLTANELNQLQVMQRNGKSLMDLIEEILDLSKLEANKLELKEEATSIQAFFQYISSVFSPQFENNKLQFELQFDLKDENIHVLMDRKKMEKVINNFLSNAIKFTPQKGKITLLVTEMEDTMLIKVSDTGKGVHPNDLPHIFDRFYQSKQADQELYGGTGIGLALVSEFAELMNGRAYAKSQLGTGSQFYFECLKKKVSSDILIPSINEEIENDLNIVDNIGTDFTILVVEDNQDMREFICQLIGEKYKVLSAQNGEEGLKVIEEKYKDIHLVISDIMMPEVDGLSMLNQIKKNPNLLGIPVIMLTALATERDKMTALTMGVDDYLTKPFSVPELMARIQNLLYNYHQRLEWYKSDEYQKEPLINKEENELILEKKSNTWINELISKIEASFSTRIITKEALSKSMNLSSRQLDRKLKSITGLACGQFIREVQLHNARKILENGTAYSISEIAYQCGFELPSSFSTTFKKRFGKSPNEYLKKNI